MVNLSRKILAKKRFQKEPSLKERKIKVKVNLFRDPYEEMMYKVIGKTWWNGQLVDTKQLWWV